MGKPNDLRRKVRGNCPMRVLLYDIESCPNVIKTWGIYEQNALKVVRQRQIISVSWKWLGEPGKPQVRALPDFPGYKRNPQDNKALILYLHKLISKADIVVGHNVARFDDKRSNTDFIKHGLIPPPPHKVIDTLRIARANFDFNSNRLGDLGEFLGCGKKVRTGGYDLWERCDNGDPKAWAKMAAYNQGDVVLLEKIYHKLKPWMKNHPDMNEKDRHTGCPVCRSTNLKKNGLTATHYGVKQRYACRDCGKTCITKTINKQEVYK